MKMAECTDKCADDFMLVTIELNFSAKNNPDGDGDDDFDQLSGISQYVTTLGSDEDTAAFLERIAKAIRERRLYGLMQQERADACCDGGQWIEKTAQDLADEVNKAQVKS